MAAPSPMVTVGMTPQRFGASTFTRISRPDTPRDPTRPSQPPVQKKQSTTWHPPRRDIPYRLTRLPNRSKSRQEARPRKPRAGAHATTSGSADEDDTASARGRAGVHPRGARPSATPRCVKELERRRLLPPSSIRRISRKAARATARRSPTSGAPPSTSRTRARGFDGSSSTSIPRTRAWVCTT